MNCSFCQTPRLSDGVRERNTRYVKKYAGYIKELNRDVIYFLIPDAISYGAKDKEVNIPYLENFLKEIYNTGLKVNLGNFPSEISPGKLTRYPEAAAILKKYVTNRKILLGGQSASERVLRIMNRDHTPGDTLNSVKILKNTGFLPVVDFLFGIPGEERKDREDTIAFIKMLVKRFGVVPNIHYFIPLPGTPFEYTPPEPLEPWIKEELVNMITGNIARGDLREQLHYFSGTDRMRHI